MNFSGDNLIISTEQGTFGFKGREAKVAVLQLNCLTSTKPVDRSQAKKLTLEKTKGSQLFTEVHLIEPVQTLSFVEGIPGGRLCVGYRNQFILVDEKNKETIQLFRTEGSRNQVVSALELWADEEHELLLCFTRTCHFQKLSLTSSSGMGSRRQAPLINSPVDTSFNWNMKTTMETSAVKSSPSLSQTQGSNSVDSPSPTGGPIARSCSPDPLFHPLNISTSCEEKVKTSDFDFAWNFEPQQVGKLLLRSSFS
ncbi:unnamed protein product [Trichobilharzia regenti]|nr:unnamed protein product [Trichobilharzia regenti]